MVNRVLFMAVVLVLALGGSTVQSQDAIDLSQPGGVTVNYFDGSRVLCVTEILDNGFTGGLWIPAPGSPSSSVWASCNVPYSLTNVESITFSPQLDHSVVVELECDEGFIPEDPENFCRPS